MTARIVPALRLSRHRRRHRIAILGINDSLLARLSPRKRQDGDVESEDLIHVFLRVGLLEFTRVGPKKIEGFEKKLMLEILTP